MKTMKRVLTRSTMRVLVLVSAASYMALVVVDGFSIENGNTKTKPWLNRGLIISSFSDGLENNDEAKDFLMHSLVSSLSRECQQSAEQEVAESAIQSPCCGPTDLQAMERMELADSRSDDLRNKERSWEEILESLAAEKAETDSNEDLEVRVLFIPTAMYALRSDSTRTPGKQRQRARADGKKRRNGIVSMLSEQLDGKATVLSITGDLDDNSAKQPEGAHDASRFPTVSFGVYII